MTQPRRIAVTGGPGAGKTTVWRALANTYPDHVVAVSEVATALMQAVFPRVNDEEERCLLQRAIFDVQHRLEDFHARRLQPGQVLLCDRGTPDGAAYWPGGHDAFFDAMNTSWMDELARYDAVLFLETAAAGGLSIAHGNEVRNEAPELAIAIDRRLREIWSNHPRVHVVAHQPEFDTKVELGTRALRDWLTQT